MAEPPPPALNNQLFENVPQHLQKPLACRWWNNKKAYAITVSPKAKDEPLREHLEQYDKIFILGVMHPQPFWLVPERDAKGRLHYHGCIKSSEGQNQYIAEQLMGLAFCKFVAKPGKRWLEYCFKDPVVGLGILEHKL